MLRITGFAGAALALHPKLLPDSVGVMSLNQKLGRGDLRPLHAPATVAAVGAGRRTIYRMGRDAPSDTNYWLSWTTLVNVVRGWNAADTAERTYYSGDGFPKWTDTTKALGAAPPTAWRALGLPAPEAPPVLENAGGVSTDAETRVYVYTYVSDADEESAPSPPTTVTCKPDDTVTITNLAAAPAGSYGINRIRVYRTETGTSGATDFYFLREIASNETGTTDDNRDLGEVLPTVTWLPAPGVPQGGALNLTEPALRWLTGLWNGMMAGLSGRGIRFCEAYIPYAWPIGYEVVPADVTPIALGFFAQSLVVLTNGRPVILTGSTPDAMTEVPVQFVAACISETSVVSMDAGVAWASPDGLAFLGADGYRLLTAATMTKEDWQGLAPAGLIGAAFEGRYFGFYKTAAGVKRSFMVDPLSPGSLYFSDIGADAVYVDDLQGAMYILNGTEVQRWEAGAGLTAMFRTKLYDQLHDVPAFPLCKVVADAYPVTVRLFADGALVVTAEAEDVQPFRVESDFRYTTLQVEIETTGPVQAVVLADSLGELGGAT